MERLKFALPKGRLLKPTRSVLESAGLGFDGYAEGSRHYCLVSSCFPHVTGKIFQEKDVPIQVAIGNYDLGVCGRQWVEEFLVRYPLGGLVRVRDFEYGRGSIFAAADARSSPGETSAIRHDNGVVRIVSEYPNLAESFALALRLRRFKVFPVWGAAEAYLPENSDVAVIWRESEDELAAQGLRPLRTLAGGGACLIANASSWARKDMGKLLEGLCRVPSPRDEAKTPGGTVSPEPVALRSENDKDLWMALPDGHQQSHVASFLARAGIATEEYGIKLGNNRPHIGVPGVKVKVVRPQDMPQQVANRNFDVAITGRDWLTDHLYRFPSSPVQEALDLGFGKVRIVAAISGETPVQTVAEVREWMRGEQRPYLRVASEYVNIADNFAREHHLSPYKIVPTWGATEAFIPEDADIVIENTETGRTLAEHNLRIIDTLATSSGCLIVNRNIMSSPDLKDKVLFLVQSLAKGLSA
ncbi:MAG: ATP phosphoribosyltransferase [Chloroflexi bacterium]|nr:ATP phosphoribosyltransferase [Chloroflexota bacterium]